MVYQLRSNAFPLKLERRILKMPQSSETPDDIVEVAYAMLKAAEADRDRDTYLSVAHDKALLVSDRLVGDNTVRHVDVAFIFDDIRAVQCGKMTVASAQINQCLFNEETLGNDRITKEQLAAKGAGGR